MPASRKPPTVDCPRLLLLILAQVGKRLRLIGMKGAAMEKWALQKLGVWADEDQG